MESILGIQTARLVPGLDLAPDHSRVRARVVRRRAGKKPDQPSSWNWPGYLCDSHFPSTVGLVPTQERE